MIMRRRIDRTVRREVIQQIMMMRRVIHCSLMCGSIVIVLVIRPFRPCLLLVIVEFVVIAAVAIIRSISIASTIAIAKY